MKVIYNSKLAKVLTFLRGYKTITVFGVCLTENSYLTTKEFLHESAHAEQQDTMFSAGLALAVISLFVCFAFNKVSLSLLWLVLIPFSLFYVWYFVEYTIRLITHLKGRTLYDAHMIAYKTVSFEAEAYDLQEEWVKPCNERKTASSFTFLKYM